VFLPVETLLCLTVSFQINHRRFGGSTAHQAPATAEGTWTEQQTERILLAVARVGQHVFALNVLANCGGRCVFCGLNPGSFGARRMLVAGHIKPWKDSTSTERLDLRNGLAGCPSHDV